MLWFSWNPWHAPMPSSAGYGQSFPTAAGPVGASEEAVAIAKESGDKMVYIPMRMGWF